MVLDPLEFIRKNQNKQRNTGYTNIKNNYDFSEPQGRTTNRTVEKEEQKEVKINPFEGIKRIGSFIADVTKVGGKLVPGITSSVFNFVKKRISEDVSMKPTQRIIHNLKLPITLAKGTTELVAKIPGYASRQLISGSLSFGGKDLQYTPQGKVQQYFLGKEPIKTFQKRLNETRESSLALGVKPENSQALAVFGVGLGTMVDAIGLTPGKGSVKKQIQKEIEKEVSKIAEKELAKEITEKIGKEALRLSKIPTNKRVYEMEKTIADISDNFVKVSENPNFFSVDKYVEENLLKREVIKRGEKKVLSGKLNDAYKLTKRKLVDSFAPIEDVLNYAERKNKFTIIPQKDFRLQVDRVLRAPSIAGQFIKDNGLKTVIEAVPSLNKLDQYLIAKQAKDVAKKGFETGRNIIKDNLLIKELKEAYEPYAKKVTSYNRKLLDKITETGLISKELSKELKTLYPNYVPLNRVFNELEQSVGYLGGKASASLSAQTVIKKLKGSFREIENPIESIISKTNDVFKQGEKNLAARFAVENIKNIPGNPLGIKQIEKAGEALNKISYLDDGVKKTFAVPDFVETAAKNLDIEQMNILSKVINVPVRIAKAGITGMNPAFLLANIVKDSQMAAITSRNSFRTSIANPAVFLKSLWSTLRLDKKGKEGFAELIRSGGIGTSFDVVRDQLPATIKRIRSNKNLSSKIKYTITHPGELFRAVENILGRSEEITRLQQFHGTKQALLKKGASKETAHLLGAKAARENTANFFRKGEWGRVLNGAFLYLNAGIQGSRSVVRSFSRQPIQTSGKIASTLLFPMAMITAWNTRDESKRQVYNDIEEWEKENSFILIPDNVTKDENGKWNIIKIPMPAGLNELTIPLRRMIEGVEDKKILTSIINSVSPIDVDKPLATLVPQAIKPYAQYAANYDFFTGYNTVPYSLEKVSPEKQVKESTSGTTRIIGEKTGLSPIKTEKFFKDVFGELGLNMLNLSDKILAGIDVIPEEQIGGRGFVESIVRRFKSVSGGALNRESEDKLKDLLQDQADESLRLKMEAEVLNEELKTLPPEEANAKASALKKTDIQLFNKLKTAIEEDKLGLTYEEKLIKQLQVQNGARAEFIFSQVEELKTDEERNNYIKELRMKKVISDTVFEQLKELKRNN